MKIYERSIYARNLLTIGLLGLFYIILLKRYAAYLHTVLKAELKVAKRD